MAFQWLQMRITEEQERRQREALVLDRLPLAMDDLHRDLAACIDAYNSALGGDSALLQRDDGEIRVAAGVPPVVVRLVTLPELPGFEIRRGEAAIPIEVGVLPNHKLYYRDREADQYLTMDELTRRILDRVLFPKLKE